MGSSWVCLCCRKVNTRLGNENYAEKSILRKDTCYLTDEETAKRVEIIQEKNKAYLDGVVYVAPAKTKTIIVDTDGIIYKIVGTID